MIAILHPVSMNWFYEKQADIIVEGLNREGRPARSVASNDPGALALCADEMVLVINHAETMRAAEKTGCDERLALAMRRFRHRVLINYDCLISPWFTGQMMAGADYFSAILDVSMAPQTTGTEVLGVPYAWIPEAMDSRDVAAIEPWSEGRPIPWTMIGHATRERAALVAAMVKALPENGFVFSPSLRPFDGSYGLQEATIHRILAKSDFYIWGSHHRFPYHEALRAPHAVKAGAIPVKIDPLYSHLIKVPWIYPSLDAFKTRVAQEGRAALYAEARDFVAAHADFGSALSTALDRLLSRKRAVS